MTTSRSKPAQPQDKFIVRLPDGMRERIAEAAQANNRSMNAEIVHRLEASFPDLEQEFLDQRTNELARLKASIERNRAALDGYRSQLDDPSSKGGIRDWLVDVIKRYEADITRLSLLQERIEADIAAIVGASDR